MIPSALSPIRCSDISGSGEDREEQELLYNKANEWYLRSIELSSESLEYVQWCGVVG